MSGTQRRTTRSEANALFAVLASGFQDLAVMRAPAEPGRELDDPAYLAALQRIKQKLPELRRGLSHVQDSCKGRVFFTTKTGFMGLGPATELGGVRVGDRICLVNGASTLSVIRKVGCDGGEQDCFELIGETYVEGLMDGEAAERSFGEEREIALQ